MTIHQAVLDDDDLYYTDMPVGEILRRARMHYGQSLREVEKILRIRASQIEAIEEGRYDTLPGRVYAIGFIRAYSDYLGLDADRMVQLFKIQSGGKTSRPILHFPAGVADSKTAPFWLILISVIAIGFFVMLWYADEGEKELSLHEIPRFSSPIKQSDSATPAFSDMPLPGQAAPMGPFLPAEPSVAQIEDVETGGIILNVLENSWVEIRDESGNQIVSRVLKAGERYYVPDDRPDLSMSLGNAGGVSIELNGAILSPVGQPGEVLRDLPLEAESLKNTYSLNP